MLFPLSCIVLIILAISNAQTTDSPTTNSPTTTTSSIGATSKPLFYQLGFIVGMSIMGGMILMIILFMTITACQRAHKRKAKNRKVEQTGKKSKDDVGSKVGSELASKVGSEVGSKVGSEVGSNVGSEIAVTIETNDQVENTKSDSGPF
jgi:hypothetical protein